MRRKPVLAAALAAGLALGLSAEAAPQRVSVTGEVIDTFCYLSGVMGGPEAVVGTAHHKCALWCAAGGIPVGVLGDDGTVYMVLKVGEDTTSVTPPTLFLLQSHRVTVEGDYVERDGIKYLMISQVVDDEGIVNLSHEDFGVVPPFAVPK